MLKERIMRLVKDGTIILDFDDVVESNHIFCQIRGLSIIQFRSLGPFVLYEHGLPNPATQERSFLASVFNKIVVNMTSCFEIEEEIGNEDDRQENSVTKIDNTLATLEAISALLN